MFHRLETKEKVMKRNFGWFFGFAVLVLAAVFSLVGCESTPAVPTQIINGVIIDSYQGNSTFSGDKGMYYLVDQDRDSETKEDQRLLFVGDYAAARYPNVKVGADVVFSWDQYSNRDGCSSSAHLISINGEKAR
jgi:hypothetical protein